MRTLYGAAPSPFVRKVRVVLAEKEIPYDLDPVGHHLFPPTFRRVSRELSPLGKIPAYRDDAVGLADSAVICDYLEQVWPDPPLYPRHPPARARALWFEKYADTALGTALTFGIFVPAVVWPLFSGKPRDEAALERAIAEHLPPLFDYLESQIEGAGPLVDEAFSIADIAVTTQFVNFCFYAGFEVDAGRWPRLARYLDDAFARPSFSKLIEQELADWRSGAAIAPPAEIN